MSDRLSEVVQDSEHGSAKAQKSLLDEVQGLREDGRLAAKDSKDREASKRYPELPDNNIIPENKYSGSDQAGLRRYNLNEAGQIKDCVTRTNYTNGDFVDSYYDSQRPEGNIRVSRRTQTDGSVEYSSLGQGNVDRGSITANQDGTSLVRTVAEDGHSHYTRLGKNHETLETIDATTDAAGNTTQVFSGGQLRSTCANGTKFERSVNEKSVVDDFYDSQGKAIYSKTADKSTVGRPVLSTDAKGTNHYVYSDQTVVSVNANGTGHVLGPADPQTKTAKFENFGPKPEDHYKADVITQPNGGVLWKFENGSSFGTNADSTKGWSATAPDKDGAYNVQFYGPNTRTDNYIEHHLKDGQVVKEVQRRNYDDLLLVDRNSYPGAAFVEGVKNELDKMSDSIIDDFKNHGWKIELHDFLQTRVAGGQTLFNAGSSDGVTDPNTRTIALARTSNLTGVRNDIPAALNHEFGHYFSGRFLYDRLSETNAELYAAYMAGHNCMGNTILDHQVPTLVDYKGNPLQYRTVPGLRSQQPHDDKRVHDMITSHGFSRSEKNASTFRVSK